MSARDDGGPAYPRVTDSHVDREETVYDGPEGMTLRDHFAARAMQSMLMIEVHSVGDVRSNETAGQWIARKAYAMADAMLKARQV